MRMWWRWRGRRRRRRGKGSESEKAKKKVKTEQRVGKVFGGELRGVMQEKKDEDVFN